MHCFADHFLISFSSLRSKRYPEKSCLKRVMSPRFSTIFDMSLNPNPNMRSGFPLAVLHFVKNSRISSRVKIKEQSLYHVADTLAVLPKSGAYIPTRIT